MNENHINNSFINNMDDDRSKLLNMIKNTDYIFDSECEVFLRNYLEKINKYAKTYFSEYIIYRRNIIELLDNIIKLNDDKNFMKEKLISELIYQQNTINKHVLHNRHNLWLIDEQLTYCDFLASDQAFINCQDKFSQDFLVFDKNFIFSDISNKSDIFNTIFLFQFKRLMYDEYTESNNPVQQLISYTRELRNNNVLDSNNKLIKVNNSTKFYLYAVCDITPSLKPILDGRGFWPTSDNLGSFHFLNNFNAEIKVLSYDKIVNDSMKRNNMLFEKL
ncbi:MAG: hypothetical protein LBS60_02770 [Deltaproteobacteria bacterium]|jgi:hypothetical protein|nr:hypothetical protein [Deltaproteobacteria bacterium]